MSENKFWIQLFDDLLCTDSQSVQSPKVGIAVLITPLCSLHRLHTVLVAQAAELVKKTAWAMSMLNCSLHLWIVLLSFCWLLFPTFEGGDPWGFAASVWTPTPSWNVPEWTNELVCFSSVYCNILKYQIKRRVPKKSSKRWHSSFNFSCVHF